MWRITIKDEVGVVYWFQGDFNDCLEWLKNEQEGGTVDAVTMHNAGMDVETFDNLTVSHINRYRRGNVLS